MQALLRLQKVCGERKDLNAKGRRQQSHNSCVVISVQNQSHAASCVPPRESRACSLLWKEQFVTRGEQCITPVTGSAYRKAWDWPGAICLQMGEGEGGRKDVGRFASLWLYISEHQRKRRGRGEERVCDCTRKYTEEAASCSRGSATHAIYLIQSDLHTVVLTTVALDIECFSLTQATVMRGKLLRQSSTVHTAVHRLTDWPLRWLEWISCVHE